MTPAERPTKHHPQHPPRVLVDWLDLAIKYAHAGLGNSMTDQTRYALMGLHDFMSQPAEAYCCLHYSPCQHHEEAQ